jgi:hypothetical protein
MDLWQSRLDSDWLYTRHGQGDISLAALSRGRFLTTWNEAGQGASAQAGGLQKPESELPVPGSIF